MDREAVCKTITLLVYHLQRFNLQLAYKSFGLVQVMGKGWSEVPSSIVVLD